MIHYIFWPSLWLLLVALILLFFKGAFYLGGGPPVD